MIRVVLPHHLRTLARVDGAAEVVVELAPEAPVCANEIVDALEAAYPALKGTIRDHATKERRAYLRYFACGADISHEPADRPLPEGIATGDEPFMVVGAVSGG